MGLESTVNYPKDLNKDWPLDTDTRRQGDDHIRHVKNALVNYSKTLSGVAANTSAINMLLPVGALYIGSPDIYSDPSDDIGGTWDLAGTIPFTPDNTPPPGIGAWTTLRVWIRIA